MSFDGVEVDLDDPKTYDYLPDTQEELDNRMFLEIGKTLVYMDYFPERKHHFPKEKQPEKFVKLSELFPDTKFPDKEVDINNAAWEQRQRINKLIENFAENRKNHYNDKMWCKEQIFLLEDETENMC